MGLSWLDKHNYASSRTVLSPWDVTMWRCACARDRRPPLHKMPSLSTGKRRYVRILSHAVICHGCSSPNIRRFDLNELEYVNVSRDSYLFCTIVLLLRLYSPAMTLLAYLGHCIPQKSPRGSLSAKHNERFSTQSDEHLFLRDSNRTDYSRPVIQTSPTYDVACKPY